jgi:hypothetical protein
MSFLSWGWTSNIPLKDMPVQVKGDHYWYLFDGGLLKNFPLHDHRRNLIIALYYQEPGMQIYTRIKRISYRMRHGFGYTEYWLHLADGRKVGVWSSERVYSFTAHPEVTTF